MAHGGSTDSMIKVCRCVVEDQGSHFSSGSPISYCMGPSSNTDKIYSKRVSSTDLSTQSTGTQCLRQQPVRVLGGRGGGRGGKGGRVQSGHLPLLSPSRSPQHNGRARAAGRSHPAPRRKEASNNSSCGGSNHAGAPRVMMRKQVGSAALDDSHFSVRCSSIDREGGGGTGDERSVSKQVLTGSPHAYAVSNGTLLADSKVSGQQRTASSPPAPVPHIAVDSAEEDEVTRNKESRKTSVQSHVGDDSERKPPNASLLPSFRGGGGSASIVDSPRSVDSASSFETLASAGVGSVSQELDRSCMGCSREETETGVCAQGNGGAASAVPGEGDEGQGERGAGLGVVDRTLFESWKTLPWQARLCPKAIEEQEDMRRRNALEKERLRVKAWKQEQQILATSAAKEEERIIADWWKAEAEKVWALQSQRRGNHKELAALHEEKLGALENGRADLLSVGYGKELAELDGMDEDDHIENLRHAETLLDILVVRRRRQSMQDESEAPDPVQENGSEHNERGSDEAVVITDVPATAVTSTTALDTSELPRGDYQQTDEERERQHPPHQSQDEGGVQPNLETNEEEDDDGHLDRIDQVSGQTERALERVACHASAVAAVAETFCRRRQSLAYLLYRGLAEVYRHQRAVARRSFVRECAADIGRIKQLASSNPGGGRESCSGGANKRDNGGSGGEVDVHPSSNDGISGTNFAGKEKHSSSGSGSGGSSVCCKHGGTEEVGVGGEGTTSGGRMLGVVDTEEALTETTRTTGYRETAGARETRRVTRELRNEAMRVALQDKLQREILRRSTREVTRLLVVDSLRRAPVDGGGMWSKGRQQEDGRFLGNLSAESVQAAWKRARVSMRELRRRQAEACSEAGVVERSWMAALSRWKSQLDKARSAAVDGEIGEVRILQDEDAEALAAQENAVVSSLERRRAVLTQTWQGVYEEERSRIDDTSAAYRHCLLGASSKLRELVEDSRRERRSTAQFWEDEMAVVMERSQSLADLIDREAGVIDDAQSVLTVELSKIVDDSAAEEAEATAEARRGWWKEAGESLLGVFAVARVDSGCGGGGGSGDGGDGGVGQGSDNVRAPSCSKQDGSVPSSDTDVGARADEKTPSSVASQLLHIRARLDDLLHAEEARVANFLTDAAPAADDAVGGGRDTGRGKLHLAVSEKERCSSEAITRCTDAVEAFPSEPSALRGKEKQRNGSGVSSGSADGSCCRIGTAAHQEELDSFRSRMEGEAVQLAAASFETEVTEMVTGPAGQPSDHPTSVAEAVNPGEERSSSLSSLSSSPDDCTPKEMTRAQLDLRRATRVRAFAQALGDVMLQGCKALLEENLQGALKEMRQQGQFSGFLKCRLGCGELYCSSYCRDQHLERGHRLLCVGPIPTEDAKSHPLVAFRVHAMETNEIFLMVGEVLAQVATAFFRSQRNDPFRSQGGNPDDASVSHLQAARAPFADFVQNPWWDVALHRGVEDTEVGPEKNCGENECDFSCSTDDDSNDEKPLCDEESCGGNRSCSSPRTDDDRSNEKPACDQEGCRGNECGSSPGTDNGRSDEEPDCDQDGCGRSDCDSSCSMDDDGSDEDEDEESDLDQTLRDLCKDSSAFLRKAFALSLGPLPAALEDALSAENFSRVVGMFEQNNVGIRSPSPIPQALRNLLGNADESIGRDLFREVLTQAVDLVSQVTDDVEFGSENPIRAMTLGYCASIDRRGASGGRAVSSNDSAGVSSKARDLTEEDVAMLQGAIDRGTDVDESGQVLFAPLDGTALYSLVCCMNHSCRPNCIVRYPGRKRASGDETAKAEPLVAEVVLLESVSAGDELTQSYIAKEMDFAERREALKDYGFVCVCPRCSEEAQEVEQATSSTSP